MPQERRDAMFPVGWCRKTGSDGGDWWLQLFQYTPQKMLLGGYSLHITLMVTIHE